jgi:hypothetical protein
MGLWSGQPDCEYRCQRCGCVFHRENPGPVLCENCGHEYVDWLNSIEVLSYIYTHSSYLSNRGNGI